MMECIAFSAGLYRPVYSYAILASVAKDRMHEEFTIYLKRCAQGTNRCSFEKVFLCPQQLNPLASQVAAAAAMGSIAGSQVFGNTLSSLQGASGQLVTNAQGQVSASKFSLVTDILLHHLLCMNVHFQIKHLFCISDF